MHSGVPLPPPPRTSWLRLQSPIHGVHDLCPAGARCGLCRPFQPVYFIVLQDSELTVAPHPSGKLRISLLHCICKLVSFAVQAVEGPVGLHMVRNEFRAPHW